MGLEYRKKRAETQQVISEQEIDGLRALAKIIARSLIRQSQSNQKAIQRQSHISPEASD